MNVDEQISSRMSANRERFSSFLRLQKSEDTKEPGDSQTIRKFKIDIKKFCFSSSKPKTLSDEELKVEIDNLNDCCLIHHEDSYRLHVNRLKGIELLDGIVERVDVSSFTSMQIPSVIWSMLSCAHHFYIRMRISRGLMLWIWRRVRRRQYLKAMRTYDTLIDVFYPKFNQRILQAIVAFYTAADIWNVEYFCAHLLKKAIRTIPEVSVAVHSILNVTVSPATDANRARQTIRILYQVLENYRWKYMEEHLIHRILIMYRNSVIPTDSHYDYAPLRRGVDIMIRNILVNLPREDSLKIIGILMEWTFDVDENENEDALLEFGSILEYAAFVHKTDLYRDSLTPNLLTMILQLIASERRTHSLLGNKVLQHLIDRHDNKLFFETPQVFFDDFRSGIQICEYCSEDKAFVRTYREMIHVALLSSIKNHGVDRINLESTYASIALIVVEIPCGFTAAATVCLAMAIQETTVANDNLQLDCAHRLHATVMALMSLICWANKAEVFYDYLKTVLNRRAQYAPHLNPPLKPTYHYAEHHVLWNKPDLFFEDWEARYGLWQCFKSKK